MELSPGLADPHAIVSDAYFDREWAVAIDESGGGLGGS